MIIWINEKKHSKNLLNKRVQNEIMLCKSWQNDAIPTHLSEKISGRSISCCEMALKCLMSSSLWNCNFSTFCVRAFDFNALAITHAFVFVVTTHTVVLQITVLLLQEVVVARQIQKICSCFCLILPCHD